MKIQLWNQLNQTRSAKDRAVLSSFQKILQQSTNWPWLGIIFCLPLLGALLFILILFGQKPDYLIKAWTETADWNLSEKVAPVNLQVDEHYLCTVAATGHRGLVKPIRKGVRHGHEVVVNRQLEVANAFEELLAVKCPRLHRFIRRTYDKYGYPFAKHMRHQWQADLIYLVMKPLEWFFVVILYIFDNHPENRIVRQYLPPMPDDFGKS